MMNKVAYAVGDADDRPWGRWEVLAVGDGFIIKKIDVDAGQILSLQSHEHRSEHWTILSGKAVVTLNENSLDKSVDDTVFIPAGAKHRIRNSGDETLSFLEVQTGVILDEGDIRRYEDQYGRA